MISSHKISFIHKHASTGFREELEDCKDKISGLEDKIKNSNDEIEKERATGQEAQKVLAKIDEAQRDLDYKQNDMQTEEAVYQKQKELLGKDDLTEKHTKDELKEMLRKMNDERNGNEVTMALERKDIEFQDIERKVERLRRKANELNSRKGKLEAERDAHSK